MPESDCGLLEHEKRSTRAKVGGWNTYIHRSKEAYIRFFHIFGPSYPFLCSRRPQSESVPLQLTQKIAWKMQTLFTSM